jgi:hypothetical protein
MATDVHAREQRLRKQAELQSLFLNLANLRKQEATYIEASAGLPEFLVRQITELRHEIRAVEDELLTLNDETVKTSARQFYREAFEAELSGDYDKAIKLYKSASHYNHPDAGVAIRSVRYARKLAQNKAAGVGRTWSPPASTRQTRNRLLIGLAMLFLLILVGIFLIASGFFAPPPETTSLGATATFTAPAVILIIPDTATPIPSATATFIPTPTSTPTHTPRPTTVAETSPTDTPTPAPTLRPALRIVGPTNNLVWLDGAVVFEFGTVDLAFDELYCLTTLRGFDQTNTENWSFPPTGSKEPAIAIEANVFRVAKAQDMRCIVWSAGIGKGSCENIISHSTEERVIGLPQPCKFR